MKHLKNYRFTLIIAILLPLLLSCEKEAEEFANSEPVTYYLSNDASLSVTAGSDGQWNYITNYIYPESTSSTQWNIFLDNNITKGEFGYDLIFWSEAETTAIIEFILKEDGQETVLASKELTITYIDETTAIHHHNDISTSALEGTNPMSGKNGELIFRITHTGGEDRIEILYDAATGKLGCTSIIVFEDK